MSKFRLIQRGKFRESGTTLTGSNGVVNLDYMGSSEFEWGAIPKAYRRLMYHFSEYEIIHTGIYTPEKDELLVFCKKKSAENVVQSIKEFISNPYHLKEYSQLELVPTSKKNDTSWWDHRYISFWWCIDINDCHGDWMAFLQSNSNLFKKAVNNDYQNWWMKMTPEDREEEYKDSLHW